MHDLIETIETVENEHFRMATIEDGPTLCKVFSSVAMEADLHLTVDRSPDFFGLYKMQGGEQYTFVISVDGHLEGLATMLIRDGYLHGKPARIAYAGDLRLTRKVRGGQFLGNYFGPLFPKVWERAKVDAMYTSVIASNKAAVARLVQRNHKYPQMPVYSPLRDMKIMNIQFGLKKVSRSTDFRVRRATNEDLPAIAKHLHNDHVQRPFGYHFDEAELRQRFEMWPQFDINSFYLAEDGAGRLQGMCATWDAQTTKRYRVLGYHRWMRWKRWGFNAASVFTGAPALPSINGVFRYFYLTHVSVPSENPAVMSALVDRVYADNHGKGYHFFTACVYRDDPLREAYRPYMQNSLPACLYAMSAPEHERDNYDYGAGRTGFEMAFA